MVTRNFVWPEFLNWPKHLNQVTMSNLTLYLLSTSHALANQFTGWISASLLTSCCNSCILCSYVTVSRTDPEGGRDEQPRLWCLQIVRPWAQFPHPESLQRCPPSTQPLQESRSWTKKAFPKGFTTQTGEKSVIPAQSSQAAACLISIPSRLPMFCELRKSKMKIDLRI